MSEDDFDFKFQTVVQEHVRRLVGEVDARLEAMFRSAYDAGYGHGQDDALHENRGIGPRYAADEEPDSFEKWLREFKKEMSDD